MDVVNTVRLLKHEKGSGAQDEVRPLKRDLTSEERQGLYILFGLLGSTWLVGSLVDRMGRTKGHS